jgi:RHO protein GDP dissociation inhibitor
MPKTSQPSTPQAGIPSRGRHTDSDITYAGYKPAAGKTVDEYRNLDAGDESLARWKASLGLETASGGDRSKPKVALCFSGMLAALSYPSRSLASCLWS